MQDANLIGDVIAVQYPSNHSLVDNPKILFVGKGLKWKEDLQQRFMEYWTDTPLTFFYVAEDEYTEDNISWIYNNMLHCDFIIGNISDDPIDIALLGPNITKDTTYLMFNEKPANIIQMFYTTLSANHVFKEKNTIILSIKDKWLAKYG